MLVNSINLVSFRGKANKKETEDFKAKDRKPTQKESAEESSRLFHEIEVINDKIFKLEVQCMNASKNNSEFDQNRALQEIGRLINHKIMLQMKMEEAVKNALGQL